MQFFSERQAGKEFRKENKSVIVKTPWIVCELMWESCE
jgi:hypothetical protein